MKDFKKLSGTEQPLEITYENQKVETANKNTIKGNEKKGKGSYHEAKIIRLLYNELLQ